KKLIAEQILGERNIFWSDGVIKPVHGVFGKPGVSQRVPGRRGAGTPDVKCTTMENESIDLAQNFKKCDRQSGKNLLVID
ncbi:MAG TPA: hypothetical protein VM735_08920, partial [Candidatus Kapabacteria bacterium]|nr:hypothetical protein [Candidatus Kapabacteria bacterium]